MSINFCTLTSSSLDAFCGNRRAIVIQNLLDEKYPTAPPIGGGRSGYFYEPHDVGQLIGAFEQPWISVDVTIDGEVHSETLEASQNLDFVVVSAIEMHPVPEVYVSDLVVDDPGFGVNITELSHE